jgi:hypothetical protein
MERSIHHPQAGGAYLDKPKSLRIPLRYVGSTRSENPWVDTFSLTCSWPKLTMPSPSPTGPARDFFGQPKGPSASSTACAQVAKPLESTLVPAGESIVRSTSGDGNPPYSVPVMVDLKQMVAATVGHFWALPPRPHPAPDQHWT